MTVEQIITEAKLTKERALNMEEVCGIVGTKYEWELGSDIIHVLMPNLYTYWLKQDIFKAQLLGYPIRVSRKPKTIKLWREV